MGHAGWTRIAWKVSARGGVPEWDGGGEQREDCGVEGGCEGRAVVQHRLAGHVHDAEWVPIARNERFERLA